MSRRGIFKVRPIATRNFGVTSSRPDAGSISGSAAMREAMRGDSDAAVARRYIVWVCCGCDDCEPLDGSEPAQFPCTDHSPSMNGAEVVLAEDYDRLRDALTAISGPSDHGDPWTTAYRDAGGGYEGLQAIAREALDA